MSSIHNPGRVAGFWYLLLVVIGMLWLLIKGAKPLADATSSSSAAGANP
jgi:uncharacterized iron-regulated membrane protein